MALSVTPMSWFFLTALLLCIATSSSNPDQGTGGVVDECSTCFNDHYVYSSCQESYRLSADGIIDVPPEETDRYCEGPCFTETNLVLDCLHGILSSFQFYNGALIQDLRFTLSTGCGHTSQRGDFNVHERMEARMSGYYGDYGGEYGHGEKPVASVFLVMMLFSCGLLLS